MHLAHMFDQAGFEREQAGTLRTLGCLSFITQLQRSVRGEVLLTLLFQCESRSTALKGTCIRAFTRVNALVLDEIGSFGESCTATSIATCEWPFTSVHTNVIRKGSGNIESSRASDVSTAEWFVVRMDTHVNNERGTGRGRNQAARPGTSVSESDGSRIRRLSLLSTWMICIPSVAFIRTTLGRLGIALVLAITSIRAAVS